MINNATRYRAARFDHTCKDQVALIADYLIEALKPPVLAAFEQHLAQCPDCAAFLKTYKKTLETTRSFLRMRPLKQRPLFPNGLPKVARFRRIFLPPTSV